MVRQFNTERLRKDGRLIHVSLTVSPIRDSAERLQGVSTIARDITPQVEMEAALRRRERELADLFDDAPLGLLWVRGDGLIDRLNRAAADLLQCGESGGRGRSLGEFFVDGELFRRVLLRLRARGTVRDFQTRLRGSRGKVQTVLIDANGLWEEKRLIHTYWFVRDITERRQLEGEVLASSERERQRLSRELHDGLGQHLSGAAYLADSLREQLAASNSEGAIAAQRLTRLVEESIQLTRDLAHGLRPVPAEPGGLMAALYDLTVQVRGLFRIHCSLTCRKPVAVEDEPAATHLYRIAQEAVHNAIRHGKATRVVILLTQRRRRLNLAVRDNGVGIGTAPPRRRGMGLSIMRYRAGLIHGSLLIRPRPCGGTEVVCSVDLRAVESAARSHPNSRPERRSLHEHQRSPGTTFRPQAHRDRR
jgi:PAS domain S-box-containing protein